VLSNLEPKPGYMNALYECVNGDKDVAVQVWACKTLASLAHQDSQLQPQALKTITAFFHQYGEGCTRADKDWGWRSVGNTLNDYFGEEGKAVIQQLMQQKEDRRVADLAWRIVYLQQEDGSTPGHMQIATVSEKEDLEAHQKHPFLKFEISDAVARDLPTVK
jgi:hypothetical protein